jgi:hypothetical protein
MADKSVNGFMVFYIDVGQLPPHKAEALLERVRDRYRHETRRLQESGVESMWIPVRPNSETRVEFFPVSTNDKLLNVISTTLSPEVEHLSDGELEQKLIEEYEEKIAEYEKKLGLK